MKKILIGILLFATLAGCALFGPKTQLVDQNTAIKYKYVIITIPDEMIEIPASERRLDTSVATDKETAKWMSDWERRYQDVEKRLKTVKSYQDRKIKELNIPTEDIIRN